MYSEWATIKCKLFKTALVCLSPPLHAQCAEFNKFRSRRKAFYVILRISMDAVIMIIFCYAMMTMFGPWCWLEQGRLSCPDQRFPGFPGLTSSPFLCSLSGPSFAWAAAVVVTTCNLHYVNHTVYTKSFTGKLFTLKQTSQSQSMKGRRGFLLHAQ